jgi:hypothetical protein
MGASTFMVTAEGKSAKEAFKIAREDAQYESGHGGYTGTIAEKDSFVMITCEHGMDPYKYANYLINACDSRIDDKWGPAGCIALGGNKFLFFGWASS